MRHLPAKIMTIMACSIILLHAVVPHHHHDCEDEMGFVFETEINCHCNHHHHDCPKDCTEHHSDHPFDVCKLADMLSHLVFNSKEEEHLLALIIKAEVYGLLSAALSSNQLLTCVADNGLPVSTKHDEPIVLPIPPLAGGHSLRAPPLCA